MPPEESPPGSPWSWMDSAASDLELARIERPPEVFREALCFHAQQAAEKSLKALLIAHGIPPPRTHNVGALLDLLPPECSPVPEVVVAAAGLTDYTVTTRYPGEYEPVDEGEYRAAVEQAEAVVHWAQGVLRNLDSRKEG